MTGASVAVRDLHFRYPGASASTPSVLAGVDFEVTPGERVAILGPNGSGKTTLMLHLNGILSPTRGTVAVGVFQDPDDQLFMPTVAEDVAFGPANYGATGTALAERVTTALTQVGLGSIGDRHPQQLSLGQRRRAAIATILSMDVDVMVLDEPTSNLDPGSRRELSATLARLAATQIIVTHDLPYALELCPRALILDGGRIVADGATGDLLADGALMTAHGLELPWGFDPTRGRS